MEAGSDLANPEILHKVQPVLKPGETSANGTRSLIQAVNLPDGLPAAVGPVLVKLLKAANLQHVTVLDVAAFVETIHPGRWSKVPGMKSG